MKIEKYSHYTEMVSGDENGQWKIEIQNDCTQIRIESEDGSNDLFINTDKKELIAIRDLLAKIIDDN